MKMDENEPIIEYVNRSKQLAADLKAMDVNMHDQEPAITILCGLPSKFENLMVAIDANEDDEKLKLDFARSRLQ